MERVTGIEPVSLAWKARVLPLHNTRALSLLQPAVAAGKSRDTAGACVSPEAVPGSGLPSDALPR